MKWNRYYSSRCTECGQSTIVVALSLGVLLLLIIGVVILCLAVFTTTEIKEYDGGKGLFETFQAQSIKGFALSEPIDKERCSLPSTFSFELIPARPLSPCPDLVLRSVSPWLYCV